MRMQKTFTPRPGDIDRAWWLVDATDLPLGRLASEVATVLRGKHKPTFAPHMDMGDFVVVVNAEKIGVTGAKEEGKSYYRHSGYPGGISSRTFRELLEKHPERVVEKAIRGMLPRNRLGRAMALKLRVYAGPDHPHAGQAPQPLTLDIRKVES
jgi:large subunit ribosomal protein L13